MDIYRNINKNKQSRWKEVDSSMGGRLQTLCVSAGGIFTINNNPIRSCASYGIVWWVLMLLLFVSIGNKTAIPLKGIGLWASAKLFTGGRNGGRNLFMFQYNCWKVFSSGENLLNCFVINKENFIPEANVTLKSC